MNKKTPCMLVFALLMAPMSLLGQGVVIDQGTFAITVSGQQVGQEEFVIRQAGLGREDAIFANGVITLRTDGRQQEVRPLLRATPPAGTAESYQVRVTGPGALELRLNRSDRRYVATIRSEIGAEDREFQARPETRILEQFVAHHYYFLRDLREGRAANALEPTTRREFNLTAGARVEEEITIGRNSVPARRVEFSAADDIRVIWYDRQGRVLRVEIPAIGYSASRTDLVG